MPQRPNTASMYRCDGQQVEWTQNQRAALQIPKDSIWSLFKYKCNQLLLSGFESTAALMCACARILVQVMIYCRLRIGRDDNLDQSEAYDIS